jgi:hypothetical protein
MTVSNTPGIKKEENDVLLKIETSSPQTPLRLATSKSPKEITEMATKPIKNIKKCFMKFIFG